MLVELRIGAGDKAAQTLAPPSTHPSGETIEWDEAGEPKQIRGDILKKRVARLAAATLLVRHYPGQGSRHQCALVLGGVLTRAGWSEDRIANLSRPSHGAPGMKNPRTAFKQRAAPWLLPGIETFLSPD